MFASVEMAHEHTEPEITCITGSGKAEGLGPLKGGHVIHCDLATCRRYSVCIIKVVVLVVLQLVCVRGC